MATSVTTPAGRAVAAADSNRWTWLVQWVKSHKQAAAYLGMLGGVVAVLLVWYLWSTRTAERTAGAQLEQARLAVDSRNFGLAASELARLVENYAGTRAAQEGTILLAQVRLAQGQNQLAVDLLRRFAPDAGKAYQAQAYGLLGGAERDRAPPQGRPGGEPRGGGAGPVPVLPFPVLFGSGPTVVAAVGERCGRDLQRPAAAGPDGDRRLCQAPFHHGAGGCHRTRPAGQRFRLDPPLVGSHQPLRGRVSGGDEVHVRALRPQGRIGAKHPAATVHVDAADVVNQHDEVRHPDRSEGCAAFPVVQSEARHSSRSAHRTEAELGSLPGIGAATVVDTCVRLELHPLAVRDAQSRGEAGAA